jgi:hypothetical protein
MPPVCPLKSKRGAFSTMLAQYLALRKGVLIVPTGTVSSDTWAQGLETRLILQALVAERQ